MAKKKVDRQDQLPEQAPEQLKGRKAYDVSPQRFVEVWQTSGSADEVAERLDMPKPIVHARASNYRSLGVKLKKMPRSSKLKLNVEALNQQIEQFNARQRGEAEEA
jgi:hypothetical protein